MKTLGVVTLGLLLASMAMLYGQPGAPPRVQPIPQNDLAPSFSSPAPPSIPPVANQAAPHFPAKVNASILEKAFHLKLTKQKTDKTDLVLVFEFTKTIDDVDKVRAAFHAQPQPEPEGKSDRPKVYLFDEDNVVVEIKPVTKTSGIITGRAGDAFRLHLTSVLESSGVAIRKIEFRSDNDLPVARVANPPAKESNIVGEPPPIPRANEPVISGRLPPLPEQAPVVPRIPEGSQPR
jgi:hypothetical protein